MTVPYPYPVESNSSFGKLRDSIAIRKSEYVKQIAGGIASNHEDYRHRIGVLQGLDEVLELIEEIEKNERN